VTCATLLLALAGCGTPPTGLADPPPSASPSVAQVVVKPQSVSLGVQDTVDLKATALDDQGNPIPDASISWSVSDTSVVSLNNGKAKGKKTGSTTITASSGGKTGHSKVNVKKGSGTVTLSLTPQADTLAPGGTVRLDAEVTDGSGQQISGVTFNWSSSSTSVATVDSGLVTGEKAGSATITAEVQGLSADAAITVRAPSSQQTQVASVRVQPTADTVQVGSSVQLTATPLDASGNTVSGQSVTWTSSATSVATVDGSGKVTGIAQGSATITAKAGGQSGTATVTVIPDPPVNTSSGAVLATFPGAEGYGATALSQCDRSNLQVLHVTNLQDSGTGSLRDAISRVDNNAFTVIVFNVAGYIHLASDIEINNDQCLYIAGQTAPGGGITIQRAPGKGLWLKGATRDVVIRYLRFRAGYNSNMYGSLNILVGSANRVILDHLSLSWANDKLLAISKYNQAWSPEVTNVTLQRSILSEVLAAHPTALQISAEDRTNAPINNIDVHNNLFANNDHRNPDGITSGLKVVNNVIYNWHQGAGQGEEKSVTDWIGNYYKAGPMTDSRYLWEVTFQTNSIGANPSYYVLGNVGPHNSDAGAGLDAQWSGPNRVVACYYNCPGYGDQTAGQPLPDSARRYQPLASGPIPIRVQLATDAYRSVLNDVGANARLTCTGDWTSNVDAVDQRVLSEVANGTGPSKAPVTENDVGGFPSINSGTPCPDSDGDGMPDAFETRYNLNPNSAADAAADYNGDGYTNLEEFLSGRSPR
jgi:uncharacterized protein YjdB